MPLRTRNTEPFNTPATPSGGQDLLAALARRINTRERRTRADALRNAREQGEDLIRAREECRRLGVPWGKWLREHVTEFKGARAYHYIGFAELLVTRTLTLEEQWAEWQRISGNAPSAKGEGEQEETGADPGGDEPGADPGADADGRGPKCGADGNGRRKPRDGANDVQTIRLAIAKGDHPRWEEIAKLGRKTFNVDNDSEAVFYIMEDWARRLA